jgi:hypothetical protein
MIPAGRQVPATAVAALLGAIAGHLPILGPGPEQDVRLAAAAICGCGCDLAKVEELTHLLNGAPPPLPEGHGPNHIGNDGGVVAAFHPGDCITCHGHVDAGGVFHPAGEVA